MYNYVIRIIIISIMTQVSIYCMRRQLAVIGRWTFILLIVYVINFSMFFI